MTALPETETFATHALAAAQAVAGALYDATWTADASETDALLPAPGARAVSSQVGAVTLLLVTDPELARSLEGDQPGSFTAASLGLLATAATALAPLGAGTSVSGAEEVDPRTALAGREGQVVVAARLLADGVHRATIALAVPTTPPERGLPPGSPEADAAPSHLSAVPSGLELLHDVEMDVTAELGRTRMAVRDILELVPGSVVELDRAAGSPVDVLVNGTIIARGEVVVIDEEFGIRITDVVGYEEDRSR